MSVIAGHAATFFFMWLFVSAGVHKVRPGNREYYNNVLAGYDVPDFWINHQLATLLGVLEILTGVMFVLPVTRSMGALLGTSILIAYLLIMVRQIVLGRKDLDCGCAAPSGGGTRISYHLLARNFVLAVLSLVCLLPVSEAGQWGALPLAALALIIVLSIAMILCYLSVEQLISSGQKLDRLKRRYSL